MTEQAFWDIVEAAKRESERHGKGAEEQAELQAELVASRLEGLAVDQIISFQAWLEYLIGRAETAKTHAAHLLLTDGDASDDGFLYFRTWLVGQGELLYKSAVDDPDLLADRLHEGTNPLEQTEAEPLGYAAGRACEAKTGLSVEDAGWPLELDVIDALVEELRTRTAPGDRREESREWIDAADVPKALPRLAARCEALWGQFPERPRNRVAERQPDGSVVYHYRPQGGGPTRP